jgi:hypothetical protein
MPADRFLATASRARAGFLILAACLLTAQPSLAWIYAEHRAIAAQGIKTLEPEQRGALDTLWSEARAGHDARLCADPAAGDQGLKPSCIDLAAWAAIAGDHSCSPQDMLRVVLGSDWILKVAAISAKTEAGLARAKNDAERRNVQTSCDLGLERTDKDYSTRAGANNAHFLLPRAGDDDPEQYFLLALKPGAEPNAMAIYVLFHVAALRQAALLDDKPAEERASGARDALALEFFALHFLEDSFAAGHIAGSWGAAAVRKGTHDYYNEHGLDTIAWDRESMLLFGDSHMQAADLDRAGQAVRLSLSEVMNARKAGSQTRRDASGFTVPAGGGDGTFDVCTATKMPDWILPPATYPYLKTVALAMPIPFRGPGYASLPRFRAEIGPFLGIASGVLFEGADGGFTTGKSGGGLGGLDVGLRLGLGLDALLVDSGDGLVFLQGGLVMETHSTGTCEPTCPSDPVLQQFVPGVPARSGLQFRLRLPFWLIPGDLLLAAPFLAFTNPKALEKMGITAADGGLIPWQTKLSTPVGQLQFMAGREVAVNLFGYGGQKDAFLAVGQAPNGSRTLLPIAVRSVEWNFPLLELRPFREYGTRYSFAALLQIGAGFDTPNQVESLIPGVPPPQLKTRYFGYIRVLFDGRRYF